ncbi:hypothetical protein AB3S75_020404 [Citrus x aurantiifolia]
MRVSNFCFLLLQFSLFFGFHTPALAAKQSYIVYLGAHSHGPNPTLADLDRAENYHHEFLGSIIGSRDEARELISSSYRRHINGFAADLEEEHAQQLANHPEVVSVFLNKPTKKLTTGAWNFLGLEKDNVIPSNSTWEKARFGEDVIIGGIDSGIWPESESFSDEEMGPIPSNWRGTCQNDDHYGVECNRKLIGIRHYNKGLISAATKRNPAFDIPPKLKTGRDLDGHGTHTLSAAAGNFVQYVGAFCNHRYGTAKGGSPRARVASYKVCWYSEDDHNAAHGNDCMEQDTIEAFDDAIHDGVDIITVSLGYDNIADFLSDGVVIGAFHATMNGVLTVAASGNGGPEPQTINNMAPWMLTVGASTMDREFAGYITLGNNKRLRGASLSVDMPRKSYPLISGEDARMANATEKDARSCKPGTLDRKKVQGRILLCLHEEKGYEAAKTGAVAMITGASGTFSASYGFLPVTKLKIKDFEAVLAYIKSTKDAKAFMTDAQTEFAIEPSPAVASFSSRGPNRIDPSIIKPDVIAPGVNIVAAFTSERGPTGYARDNRRFAFTAMDGTSMSTPIVAGIAGLIKTVHPDWSPAAIKSAIMTTARATDANNKPISEFNGKEATAFAYGSGHVDPNSALDPGLVYDLTLDDYLGYLCNRGYKEDVVKKFVVDPAKHPCPKSFELANFNYPSIAIPELAGSVTVTRKLKNVGTPGTYKAQVKEIPGISTDVEPSSLTFTHVNEEKTFKITFTLAQNAKPNATNDYVFGELIWSDGTHRVRSPIALKQKSIE